MKALSEGLANFLFTGAIWCGVAGLLAMLIPAWQSYNWLRTGQRYPVPAGMPFYVNGRALFHRLGRRPKVIAAIVEAPLAIILFLTAEGLAAAFAVAGSAAEKRVRELRSR